MIKDARPTSEPVPEVVGMAMLGATPAVFTRVQLSPTSSKSHNGNSCPAIKAMALPTSNALPPPIEITPSWPPLRYKATPRSTSEPPGLGRTLSNKP